MKFISCGLAVGSGMPIGNKFNKLNKRGFISSNHQKNRFSKNLGLGYLKKNSTWVLSYCYSVFSNPRFNED